MNEKTYTQWSSLFLKVGNAPHGNQQLDPLLRDMADWLNDLPEGLGPQSVGTLLYNLQAMPSTPGTEAVLQAMARHISKTPSLSAQAIGNALYGLQNMPSTDGTEAVLQAMARHISKTPSLSAQAIGNALYGLQNMPSTDGAEAVLKAMAGHISETPLSAQAIGNALYGLQNMPSTDGTEAVLRVIAPRISEASPLSGQEIGNALYGLQNMSSTDGTEAVLLAIAEHIFPEFSLSAQQIGNALSGLQNMSPTAGTHAVLDALVVHAARISANDVTQSDIPPATYLAECIFSVRNHLTDPSTKSLITQISRSLNLPLRPHDLTPATYSRTLWRLLNPRHIYNDPQHGHLREVDLHHLSHKLGRAFCTMALHRLLPACDTLRVVYGSSRHLAANKGKMRESAELALSQFKGEGYTITYAFQKNRPSVQVTKTAESAHHTLSPSHSM
ncbi:hypothetical protein EO087_12320 [Dyella sp. M7H15-1]|uniref:hypothetical protein n=1 Tax=Dyella sp. M7H15-1 TaxID=2501295 RepID=UPI0010051CC1|nr:hypothetical protein [Dyella sp. M7H15-1]QAU24680.1 hypothetical protein EO087_12320 [Dyella sp. M7H15-1]